MSVVTVRLGTHTIRVEAPGARAARLVVQSDCDNNRCHCPTEWCTDDVGSDVADVRLVAFDGLALSSGRTAPHGFRHSTSLTKGWFTRSLPSNAAVMAAVHRRIHAKFDAWPA